MSPGALGGLSRPWWLWLVYYCCVHRFPWYCLWVSSEIYGIIGGNSKSLALWKENSLPSLRLLKAIATIGLVWLASGRRGAKYRAVLSLSRQVGCNAARLEVACMLIIVMLPIAFVLREAFGQGLRGQLPVPNSGGLQQFSAIVDAITLIIAAPLARLMQRFDDSALIGVAFGWFVWISHAFGRTASAPAWSQSLGR